MEDSDFGFGPGGGCSLPGQGFQAEAIWTLRTERKSTTREAPFLRGGLHTLPSENRACTDPGSVGPQDIETHSSPARGVEDAEGPLGDGQADLIGGLSHIDWLEDQGSQGPRAPPSWCSCMWVPWHQPVPTVSRRSSQSSWNKNNLRTFRSFVLRFVMKSGQFQSPHKHVPRVEVDDSWVP